LPAQHEGIFFDLLFASSGLEAEIVATSEAIELASGLVVPAARPSHLVAMKVLSHCSARPQDMADLRAPLSTLMPSDVDEARKLVE
jgi:hypothetical protein